jgi:hypothetical protein
MPAMGAHTRQPDTGATTMTDSIPGLISATGPNAPGILPPSAIPQLAAPNPAPAAPASADPIPVSTAVQAAPPTDPAAPGFAAAQLQLPTSLQLPPATTTTTVNAPSAVPGLSTATVPGLNPSPAAQQPAVQPSTTPAQPPATGEQDRGFPEGTPLEQMNAEQREAYWKHYARQWEARAKEKGDYDALKTKATQYDQLVASQATDQEKAITAARAEGERLATARAAVVLVDAHVRAGLNQRLPPHQGEALASNLNHQHFLGADGLTVDAAKVLQFVDTVAPSAQIQQPAVTAPVAPAVPGGLPVGVPTALGQPQQPVTGLPRALPDLGQGTQTAAPLDKLEAGRQQARAFLANGGFR